MGFADEIFERSRSPSAIFHRYRVDSSIYDAEHIFVEGYDDHLYYTSIVSRFKGDLTRFHICFGKRNTDKIYGLFVASSLGVKKTHFVRDSDFDVHLGYVSSNEHIFLTKGYSVENYLCSKNTVFSLASSIFCVDNSEFDLMAETNKFGNHLNSIFSWMTPIHGAIFKSLIRK